MTSKASSGRFTSHISARHNRAGSDIAAPGLVELLTAREIQVPELMASGKSNREIADEFVLVLDTVQKPGGHILDKLGAAHRTQAVVRARVRALCGTPRSLPDRPKVPIGWRDSTANLHFRVTPP